MHLLLSILGEGQHGVYQDPIEITFKRVGLARNSGCCPPPHLIFYCKDRVLLVANPLSGVIPPSPGASQAADRNHLNFTDFPATFGVWEQVLAIVNTI